MSCSRLIVRAACRKCDGCTDYRIAKTLLSNWHQFSLHPQLNRALYAQKFTSPTPIQARALPAATKGKDVIGVAETVRCT